MPKARRRRRRKPSYGPIVWVLFWANLVAGSLYSPITGATRFTVNGAKPSDRARIERELQWLKGKSPLRVNHRSVEEWLMFRPDVKKATISQNIFGQGSVEMSYYEPVALVSGTKDT